MSERREYWIPRPNVPDAITVAKGQAMAEGWRVVTVAKVKYESHGDVPGWVVDLAVRRAAA